ncbi:hypothetical protein RI367_008291 [Sorochytrium milnesiophthora]
MAASTDKWEHDLYVEQQEAVEVRNDQREGITRRLGTQRPEVLGMYSDRKDDRRPRHYRRDDGQQDSVEPGTAIVLENLHWRVTQEELKELFSEFGLVSAKLRYDHTDRSTGVADLAFESKQGADDAMAKYNGVELDNQVMNMRIASPNESGSSYRGSNRTNVRQNEGIVGRAVPNYSFRDRRETERSFVGSGNESSARTDRDRPNSRPHEVVRSFLNRAREYQSYRPMDERLQAPRVYDSYRGGTRNGHGDRRQGNGPSRPAREGNGPAREKNGRERRAEKSLTELDREMDDYMQS